MTDKTTEALKLAEEALQRSKRNHYYCEDTWYSCPKAEGGCANDAEGDDCNCGADVLNAEIDKALAAIRDVLAEPVKQQPVAVISESAIGLVKLHSNGACLPFGTKLYAAPVSAKREWVDLTDDEFQKIKNSLSRQQGWDGDGWDLALKEAVLSAFKEKNR